MLNQALPEMIAEILRENEELKRQRDEARSLAEVWKQGYVEVCPECSDEIKPFPWEKQGRKI